MINLPVKDFCFSVDSDGVSIYYSSDGKASELFKELESNGLAINWVPSSKLYYVSSRLISSEELIKGYSFNTLSLQ